jgi:hypothetical protein
MCTSQTSNVKLSIYMVYSVHIQFVYVIYILLKCGRYEYWMCSYGSIFRSVLVKFEVPLLLIHTCFLFNSNLNLLCNIFALYLMLSHLFVLIIILFIVCYVHIRMIFLCLVSTVRLLSVVLINYIF